MLSERYIPAAHDLEELSANVRERRLLHGWSQDRLAEEAGVDKATIRNLERGERPPFPSTVAKIAQAFGISVSRVWERF